MTLSTLLRSPAAAPAGPVAERTRAVVQIDQVYVLFTSIDETIRAVEVACRLATALHGGVTVLHFRPVDFGAPVDSPGGVSPAESEAFRRRLEAIDCPATVRVCLCRNARTALPAVLRERALVVIGRHRRWWPTAADRWRRTLEAAGHYVVVADDGEA
jgi:hypothetical protein